MGAAMARRGTAAAGDMLRAQRGEPRRGERSDAMQQRTDRQPSAQFQARPRAPAAGRPAQGIARRGRFLQCGLCLHAPHGVASQARRTVRSAAAGRAHPRKPTAMSLKCGIVGLPNVGKSTLFNALTQSAIPAENYPAGRTV